MEIFEPVNNCIPEDDAFEFLQGDIVGIDPYATLLPKYARRKWYLVELTKTEALVNRLDDRYCIVVDADFIYKAKMTVRVKPDILIIRDGPGEKYDAIGFLERKERVRISAVENGWAKLSEYPGWIPLKEVRRKRNDR